MTVGRPRSSAGAEERTQDSHGVDGSTHAMVRPTNAPPSPGAGQGPAPAHPSRARRTAVSVLIAVLVLATVGPLLYVTGTPDLDQTPTVPINHVVIVVMENRPFDNYFGVYCPAVGPNCPSTVNGIPPGTCVPYNTTNLSVGCIRPYNFSASQLSTKDQRHEWNATIDSINGGAMNGFYEAEHNGLLPFGHYNASTVPVYWDMAQEFGLADNFFSSALTYSLPNHWYLLAGQAPPETINISVLMKGSFEAKHDYLNAANRTKTVEDLLNNSPGTSWKYYDWALPSYQTAINGGVGTGGYSAYSYWNPLAAKYESYTQWYVNHFVSRSQFFNDTSAGQLPDISYVIPNASFSDHPPANVSLGQSYVASVVDAIEASPDWRSTAIFVTWDDYGGFYDHVAPPSIDPLGLSFRVPILVISPYTPAGLVDHSLGYFESLLRFVEWRFDLGCLTPRDCHAPLPLGLFDFSMPPRAPVFFPTSPANATYPYVPPPSGAIGLPLTGAFTLINPDAWNTAPPNPNLPDNATD